MQEDTDLFTSKVMPTLLPSCITGNRERRLQQEVAAALGYATVPVAEKQLRNEDAVARATKECRGSEHPLLDSRRELGFALGEPGGQEALPPCALPHG